VWDRRTPIVHASLRVSGAATGIVRLSFRTDRAGAMATISGVVSGQAFRAVTPAPWAPQG